jgi:biopolymer transport protein ExbD
MIEFEEFEETISKGSGPDLTPLIDMVFLLLIFFLLTSFLTRPIIPVVLPEAEIAELSKDQDISVTVRRDGSLLLNGAEISDEKLAKTLKRLYIYRQSRELIIQSDKEVHFGRVVEVMDISKKSGARTISFLVEQVQ